jgi:hypothetical protein
LTSFSIFVQKIVSRKHVNTVINSLKFQANSPLNLSRYSTFSCVRYFYYFSGARSKNNVVFPLCFCDNPCFQNCQITSIFAHYMQTTQLRTNKQLTRLEEYWPHQASWKPLMHACNGCTNSPACAWIHSSSTWLHATLYVYMSCLLFLSAQIQRINDACE